MKTPVLLGALALLAALPAVGRSQAMMWTNSGPVPLGGVRAYGAHGYYGGGYYPAASSYYAGRWGGPQHFARSSYGLRSHAFPASSFVLGSAAPSYYVYTTRRGGGTQSSPESKAQTPARTPEQLFGVCTCAGGNGTGGTVYVDVSGKGKLDDEITKALEQARAWPRDPVGLGPRMLVKITESFKAESVKGDGKKLVAAVTAIHDKLKGDKEITTGKDLALIWVKLAAEQPGFPLTVEAMRQYVDLTFGAVSTADAKVAAAFTKEQRTSLADTFASILKALQ